MEIYCTSHKVRMETKKHCHFQEEHWLHHCLLCSKPSCWNPAKYSQSGGWFGPTILVIVLVIPPLQVLLCLGFLSIKNDQTMYRWVCLIWSLIIFPSIKWSFWGFIYWYTYHLWRQTHIHHIFNKTCSPGRHSQVEPSLSSVFGGFHGISPVLIESGCFNPQTFRKLITKSVD